MRKTTLLTAIFMMASFLAPVFITNPAAAVTGSDFQAGRIIDDSVFFKGSSMNELEVQQFLDAKVPVCDTNGTQLQGGSGITRAEYGTARGYPPPYICLKDFSQATNNRPAEVGLCDAYTGSTETAAQILTRVGLACGISPKVLLVLLQKEQSLVTDDWPWSIQYRSATGYGCPDTAPCDPSFEGFFNQVYSAARQFKNYKKNPLNYNHRALFSNQIQFHPNITCGSSTVYIENQATAGLYNYTPYQPNAAALNNLYGTGDSCSTYGNRNFWRMYNDWFGSSLEAPKPTANLTVNGQNDTKIAYGGSVTVAWTSANVSNCTIEPGNYGGTANTSTFFNVTKTVQYTLNCTGTLHNVSDKATVEVAPATFNYLRSYLKALNTKQGKTKISTDAIVSLVDQAEKLHNSNADTKAKAKLARSVSDLNALVTKYKLAASVTSDYEKAVQSLESSWTPITQTVSIAPDGCSITATAPAGFVLIYGAHDGTWQRGFEDTITVPAAGTVTVNTGAEPGLNAYGNLFDDAGNLVTSQNATVTATCPPIVTEPEPLVNGGYPSNWNDAPKETITDSWGYDNRESTSYVAYRVSQAEDTILYGLGEPNQWDEAALSYGIPVDTTPQTGDVAIINSGTTGHAMYVESVNADNTITVSQYNISHDGNYSVSTIPAAGLVFIHF